MALIKAETFMLASPDPGIRIHLRNKRLAAGGGFSSKQVVLFVHGATFPSKTGFDFELPGGSWMDIAASQGFDAYCVDVRGYGHSTRPAAMAEPTQDNPPFADTDDAVKDVGLAVDFILQRRNVPKLNLVGWSWGTAITGTFTARNNNKIERLVLYAPLSAIRGAPAVTGLGAYRTDRGRRMGSGYAALYGPGRVHPNDEFAGQTYDRIGRRHPCNGARETSNAADRRSPAIS